MDEMRSFVDDLYGGGYLEHYGVKGMKWGKHLKAKTETKPFHIDFSQLRTSNISGGGGIPLKDNEKNRAANAGSNIPLSKVTNSNGWDGKSNNAAIVAKRMETAARQYAGGVPSTSKATASKVRNAVNRGKKAVNNILKSLGNSVNKALNVKTRTTTWSSVHPNRTHTTIKKNYK